MRVIWRSIALLALGAAAAQAETRSAIDPAQANAAFAEARRLSDKEGGRLWGMRLYGPMLFVDPATHAAVANEADPQGLLHKEGAAWVGVLPASVVVADTPLEWAGKRWTMVRWPAPEETFTREVKFEHELFHRIQPALHLDAPDALNLQLDAPQGRLWLQLEWRALAAALIENGPAQDQAIADALAFRAQRQRLFAGSAESERSLEIAEGIPEYTGLTAAAPDGASARWRTIAKLTDPDQTITWVRSFAYTSGPAYGLLLDRRLPGWTRKVSAHTDLALLLGGAVRGAAVTAEERAPLYGEAALRIAEAERAARADAEKARYRALLVGGPTLTLPSAGHFSFNFNPSTVISLGVAGAVYPTFHVTDAWGTLDVKAGVLVPTNFSAATVAAPVDTRGGHLEGPGWTLDLAPGWRLAPAARAGSFTVKRD